MNGGTEMDVREKLIELLTNSQQLDVLDRATGLKEAANYLIAHGVTVQEWVSVNDRFPQKDGSYLVTSNYFGKNQCIDVLGFVKDGETVDKYNLAGQQYVWYFYDSEYGYVSTHSVTHWMQLPQPPTDKSNLGGKRNATEKAR